MTFDYFFYQYLAVAFEIFIISTLIVRATQDFNEDDDFWVKHRYNLCFLAYQVGLVITQFTTRCFLIRFLPIFPTLQFFLFLVVGYMSFHSKF